MNKSTKTKSFLTLLLVVVCTSLWAQENSVKLYSNFLYLNSEYIPTRYAYEAKLFNYNSISVAFRRITKRGLIHELEAKAFFKKQNDASGEVQWKDIQVRYQLGAYSATLFNKIKIQPAGALTIFHSTEEIDVADFNEYKITNDRNGFNLSFFIHAEYPISEQLYLDINTSFLGFAFYLDYRETENPNIAELQRRLGGFHIEWYPTRLLRIGIGYTFGKKKENIISK